jgi:hypothetical protein
LVTITDTTNSNAYTTRPVVLTVLTFLPPPVINSALTATGTNGSTFGYQITASNNPTNFSATSLPSGLSVNTSTGLISGTPTQAGTFNVTISATNAGGTGSATLVITIQRPFDAWKCSHFTAAELLNVSISGDTACPFCDGISNLMKYVLNLDPKANGLGGLPVAAPMLIDGDNYLTLTYTQLIAATDVTYTVEVSGDMQTWSSGNNQTATVSVTNRPDGVTRSVIVQDLMPMDSILQRFIRLKVTKP